MNRSTILNKSFLTNLTAFLVFVGGLILDIEAMMWIGLFALSGALTNTLAIHMLFEKVPGLVGSGVIPAKFEAFKNAIQSMMMVQFFTADNIDRFVSDSKGKAADLDLAPVIEKVDLSPAFDKLVAVIMQSSFGSMLGMFGGASALTTLKEPFMDNMKIALIELTQKDSFRELLTAQINQAEVLPDIRGEIETIIAARLDELTPQMVKVMIEQIIHEHLGWLVIWGGVFGGLIGALSTLIPHVLTLL